MRLFKRTFQKVHKEVVEEVLTEFNIDDYVIFHAQENMSLEKGLMPVHIDYRGWQALYSIREIRHCLRKIGLDVKIV